MRLPTYAEHRRFCEVDGWEDKDAKSKKPKGDHHRYVKVLPDGTPLYTRVSHGTGEYRSPSFWSSILRDQLQVTQDQFWEAVDKGVPPVRASQVPDPSPPAGKPIPMELLQILRYAAGIPLAEIAAMTLEEAEGARREWEESQLRAAEEES